MSQSSTSAPDTSSLTANKGVINSISDLRSLFSRLRNARKPSSFSESASTSDYIDTSALDNSKLTNDSFSKKCEQMGMRASTLTGSEIPTAWGRWRFTSSLKSSVSSSDPYIKLRMCVNNLDVDFIEEPSDSDDEDSFFWN